MRAKILIVDQELAFTVGLQKELLNKNFEVFVANQKEVALKLAREEKPDFVLSGTLTPRGDAFQLHQWLKKTPMTRGLPIIVVDAPVEKQLLCGWRRTKD